MLTILVWNLDQAINSDSKLSKLIAKTQKASISDSLRSDLTVCPDCNIAQNEIVHS